MKGNWLKTYRKELKMSETQNQQILEHLKKGLTITPLLALNLFGCFRLSARIYDLRQDGHNIIKRTVTSDHGDKHFAEYTLLKLKEGK
jgi:hypothetical protein